MVALTLLFATSQGMAVQVEGLRTQVDPHWKFQKAYRTWKTIQSYQFSKIVRDIGGFWEWGVGSRDWRADIF